MEKLEREVTSYLDEDNGITIIETVIDLDLYSAIKLKEVFNQMCESGTDLFIVDMKFTRYVDSSGLGILIHMHTRARKKENMGIRFINVCENVMKVITLTHLEKILGIVSDMETAVRELKGLEPVPKKNSKNEKNGSNNGKSAAGKKSPEDLSDNSPSLVDEIEMEELPPELDIPDLPPVLELKIDDEHYLFNRPHLNYKQFYLTIPKIRGAVKFLVKNIPLKKADIKTMEREIYALLKNAVKHGNKDKWWRPVKVWYKITSTYAHLIIEDKGKGFLLLEEWNNFYRKQVMAQHNNDKEEIKRYQSFDTPYSDTSDRGTALFSAIKYWNEGIVFNQKRNVVAVKKVY